MKRVINFESFKTWLGEHRLAWLDWPEQCRRYRQFPKGRPIVLAGAPRSGTTWVAAMLSVPGIWHLHEPFNPNQGYWHEYFTHVPVDSQNIELDRLIDRIRTGGCRRSLLNPRVKLRGMPLRVFPVRYQRLLLKDPIACLMAAYVAKRLDARLLVLFRHPAGFVQSYCGLGWPSVFHLKHFLGTPSLIHGVLAPYEALILKASRKEGEESVAVLYGCLCKVLWQYSEDDTSVIRLQYEELASHPLEMFRSLYKQLDLPYTDKEEERHRVLTSESGRVQGVHGVYRDSCKTAEKWRQAIDPVALQRIRKNWDVFDIPLYQQDSDWMIANG